MSATLGLSLCVPPTLFSCALIIPLYPLIDYRYTYLNLLHIDFKYVSYVRWKEGSKDVKMHSMLEVEGST